jgi:hypothetical protein
MRALTRALAQAIPTATVREIDGAAHAVAFDAPGNFVQVIVETLRSSEMVKAARHSDDRVRSGADERCT